MAKGDMSTGKGKRRHHSYGNTRLTEKNYKKHHTM
ncbi:hypothetical protein EQ875_02805 [Photobacterium damselae subsp. damselae]|uniref:30S ribosomal protein THX n=1 Tax=Photobacterium damselae TaxID=38293 RepID=A0A2X1ZJ31_PHODM|nr:hypothetical protein EQ875_02805 [Photobacterium damselae subsp. damselae]SPY44385.1 Uncharacterised protein [Photobacterium damselae]SUB90984.1 Uncharacterised protein [Photobacterium damselae]